MIFHLHLYLLLLVYPLSQQLDQLEYLYLWSPFVYRLRNWDVVARRCRNGVGGLFKRVFFGNMDVERWLVIQHVLENNLISAHYLKITIYRSKILELFLETHILNLRRSNLLLPQSLFTIHLLHNYMQVYLINYHTAPHYDLVIAGDDSYFTVIL